MSKADQFRQYADEAMHWAYQPRNETNRQALLDLACTWMQAALLSEKHVVAPVTGPREAAG